MKNVVILIDDDARRRHSRVASHSHTGHSVGDLIVVLSAFLSQSVTRILTKVDGFLIYQSNKGNTRKTFSGRYKERLRQTRINNEVMVNESVASRRLLPSLLVEHAVTSKTASLDLYIVFPSKYIGTTFECPRILNNRGRTTNT